MTDHFTLANFASAFPQKGAPVHLAMGVFDGAHLGHRAIFDAAIAGARQSGGVAIALTFDPHPQVFFEGAGTVKLIYPLAQRFQLFKDCGLDATICELFTRAFASVPAVEFLSFLKKHVPALSDVYCGENFCFGSQRGGNAKTLPIFAKSEGIKAHAIDAVKWKNKTISSTRIRTALAAGMLEDANAMLGTNYFMTGTVIGGNQLGRTIGFPTLNVEWRYETRVPFGAYAVRLVDLDTGTYFNGLANYGVRPTIGDLNDNAPLLETNLLVPAGTRVPTTGANIRVELIVFLRRERKFASLNDLKQQLEQDKALALTKL